DTPGDSTIDDASDEDQARRIAAALHRHLLDWRSRPPNRDLADLGRAGEGGLLDQRMGSELIADLAARAGQDVDDALREADLFGERAPGEAGIGRLGSRLDHRGAARGARRADLAGKHGGREVPRR